MKTVYTVGAAAVVVGAVAMASHAGRLAHDAEDALVVVTKKIASAEAEIQRAGGREAQAARARSELQATLERLPKTIPAASNPVLSRPVTRAVSAEELEKKLAEARQRGESPATQQLALEKIRAGIVPNYRQFFEKLRLSPAQIDRFAEILMKRKESDADLSALIKQGIVAGNDPVVEKLRTNFKTEEHAAYRDLLGDSAFSQLQEMWRLTVAKDLVTGYGGMAVIAGAPVSAAQIEQLIQIVANADKNYRNGGPVSYSNDTIDWDIVDAQARPILSDAQWEVFRRCYCPVGYSSAESRIASAIAKAVQADAASKAAQAAKAPGR